MKCSKLRGTLAQRKLGIHALHLVDEVDAHLAHQPDLAGHERRGTSWRTRSASRSRRAERRQQALAELRVVDAEQEVARGRDLRIRLWMRSSIVTPIDGTPAGIDVTIAWKRELTSSDALRSTLTSSYMSS